MADVKISALPPATTPLTGSEVLPIVQSGTTDKVSVANLTAGRTVDAAAVSVGAGTVSAPGLTFSGDTNTGIYSPAADTIAFTEGGVEAMRLDANGNVGIGVSPSTRLDVAGTSRYTFDVSAADTVQTSLNAAGSAFANAFQNGLAHIWQTSGTERMRIAASGNVGIGTASPAWRLTAVGGATQISPGTSAQEGVRIQRSAGVCSFTGINNDNNAYNALSFATGASEAMRIDASANVGIGTSSPNARLTLDGSSPRITLYNLGNFNGEMGLGVLTGFGDTVGLNARAVSGSIVLGTNNTERMRIDASGNVGIGTTSPSSFGKFAVTGSGGTVFVGSSGQNIVFTNGGTNFISTQTAGGQLQFQTGASSNAMIIDASGNVGIGTASPGFRLQVNGFVGVTDGTSTFRIANSGGVALVSTVTNHPLAFQINDVERARITTTGDFQFNSGYGSVATAFGCRAWVNFNGTGTVAIRASGNVSSIADNGTGDYTVNFTTAMPDANYCVVSSGAPTTTPTTAQRWPTTVGTLAAGSVRILTPQDGTTSATLGDFALVNVAVFR